MLTKKFTQMCDEHGISNIHLEKIRQEAERFVFLNEAENKAIDEAILNFEKNIQNGLSVQNELSILNKYKNKNSNAFDFFEGLKKLNDSEYSKQSLKDELFLKNEEKRVFFENFLYAKNNNTVRKINIFSLLLICFFILFFVFSVVLFDLEHDIIGDMFFSYCMSFILTLLGFVLMTTKESFRNFVNSPLEKSLIKNINEYDVEKEYINMECLLDNKNKIDLFA